MQIQSIHIENYKSIRDSDKIELKKLNVLIGQNGAGKSNFLSFFKLLRSIYDRKLSDYIARNGRADDILYFGMKRSNELSGIVNFEESEKKKEYQFSLTPDIKGNMYFKKEIVSDQDGNAVMEPGNSDSEGYLRYTSQTGMGLLGGITSYHFNDTGFSSSIKMPSNTIDYAELHEDGSNIAAFLYRVEKSSPKHFNLIVNVIRSIAPFIERFVLAPDEINPNQVFLRWQEKGSDKLFSAAHLSDGTLRFICIAALLLQPDPPPVIIIDEPELGLHPYAINKLAGLITSASVKSQLIVATQSVSLVNEFNANDIIVVDRKEGQTIFKRESNEKLSEWLREYSLGELWEKNILGSNL